MEEERRLFYVAMTRAKDELQITCCKKRSRYGEIRTMEPSRFISEIPEELTEYGETEDRTPENGDSGDAEQLGLF